MCDVCSAEGAWNLAACVLCAVQGETVGWHMCCVQWGVRLESSAMCVVCSAE